MNPVDQQERVHTGAASANRNGYPHPRLSHRRDEPWDVRIIKEVIDGDEYDLPCSFTPADVVMDVGAHLGSFSWACLERGARQVFAYEVEVENFMLLERNLAARDCSVAPRNGAVWRSDVIEERLCYKHCSDPTNTGAMRVNRHAGQPVNEIIPFDDAIREAAKTSANGRIRLAKLDVEGSEFPILYTASCLALIDEIVGEYHAESFGIEPCAGLPPFSMEQLGFHLQGAGFTISWSDRSPNEPGIGIFRALRGSAHTRGKE